MGVVGNESLLTSIYIPNQMHYMPISHLVSNSAIGIQCLSAPVPGNLCLLNNSLKVQTFITAFCDNS